MISDTSRFTRQSSAASSAAPTAAPRPQIDIALLTGGDDKTYAIGLTLALAARNIFVDYIGSTAIDSPELHTSSLIEFLNLRGDQTESAPALTKIRRILLYYARLIRYAFVSKRPVFHILWNNKFELVDRIALMILYRLMGKKLVFTAHNVNAAKRDGRDSVVNRASLRFQYFMCDRIFVHTNRMKDELCRDFGAPAEKVCVIPFGINNTYPTTRLSFSEAKSRLGLAGRKTMLFFGQIAPYKGLDHLVAAMAQPSLAGSEICLIIAGKVKQGHASYWETIDAEIARLKLESRIVKRVSFIPEQDVEIYFKAADVLILPYVEISQSGLPFLAYSFGLPVVATDVGELKEDVIPGETGFMSPPRDPAGLASSISAYFSSDLYSQLDAKRRFISEFANERYSWSKVGEITRDVYEDLLAAR
jgi:glycosyltransferase involved in cell wall biosynthesis